MSAEANARKLEHRLKRLRWIFVPWTVLQIAAYFFSTLYIVCDNLGITQHASLALNGQAVELDAVALGLVVFVVGMLLAFDNSKKVGQQIVWIKKYLSYERTDAPEKIKQALYAKVEGLIDEVDEAKYKKGNNALRLHDYRVLFRHALIYWSTIIMITAAVIGIFGMGLSFPVVLSYELIGYMLVVYIDQIYYNNVLRKSDVNLFSQAHKDCIGTVNEKDVLEEVKVMKETLYMRKDRYSNHFLLLSVITNVSTVLSILTEFMDKMDNQVLNDFFCIQHEFTYKRLSLIFILISIAFYAFEKLYAHRWDLEILEVEVALERPTKTSSFQDVYYKFTQYLKEKNGVKRFLRLFDSLEVARGRYEYNIYVLEKNGEKKSKRDKRIIHPANVLRVEDMFIGKIPRVNVITIVGGINAFSFLVWIPGRIDRLPVVLAGIGIGYILMLAAVRLFVHCRYRQWKQYCDENLTGMERVRPTGS